MEALFLGLLRSGLKGPKRRARKGKARKGELRGAIRQELFGRQPTVEEILALERKAILKKKRGRAKADKEMKEIGRLTRRGF